MKYEPNTRPPERKFVSNLEILKDDLAHAESVITWQEKEIERLTADLKDAGTLLRRLMNQMPKITKLCEQIWDWLGRKGLAGSILRKEQP